MRRLKPFLTLIQKEWRDTRALTVACALLVPVALLAMNVTYLDWRADVGAWFVLAAALLYLVVVAADLVAADVSSRRAQSYAALPVGASSLWTAKIAFLALAALGFAAWTLAVTGALYGMLAPPDAADRLTHELGRISWWMIWAGIAGVSTVVFWSTVLERGLATVGAALVTCAALGGALPLLAWIDRELLPSEEMAMGALVALPVVFLAGSFVTFVRAPHHASTVLRRLTLAAVIPLAVLLPAGAVSAAVLLERLDVELGAPDVTVAPGHLSPDGRRLVLLAAKGHRGARAHTWILDLEDGSLAALPQRGLQAAYGVPWTTDDAYVAWTSDLYELDLRREYDPETGQILRTRSRDQVNAARSYPWVAWATTRHDGADMVITMAAEGIERRLPWSSWPRFSQLPGFVIHRGADGPRLLDLRSGTSRLLSTDRNANARFSPGGSYVQVWAGGKQAIIATRTGEPVAVDTQAGFVYWPGGGSRDDLAIQATADGQRLVDLRSGRAYDVGFTSDQPIPDLRVLPGNRVAIVHTDGRVIIRDLAGTNERTIFDPRSRD